MFFAYLSVHKCYNFNKMIYFVLTDHSLDCFLKNKVNVIFRKQNQHERSPSNSFCSHSIVTELQRGERNLDFFRQALDEELCYCQKTVATKRQCTQLCKFTLFSLICFSCIPYSSFGFLIQIVSVLEEEFHKMKQLSGGWLCYKAAGMGICWLISFIALKVL